MLTIAGLFVALLAPATGIWVDPAHRRRPALALLTGVVVAMTCAMSLIRTDYHYLWPGLILLAFTAACSDLATVPYNAMLRQLSTAETWGRISGLGSAAGYVGSVMLLLIIYFGFIQGDGDTRGLLGLAAVDGGNVRAAMLLAAAWLALFAWPLLVSGAPRLRRPPSRRRLPRRLSRVVGRGEGEWRRDRNVVYYLLASAVFRDGLTGVFAFGAVLGVSVYGVSQADVLVFGMCASVVAAIGAVLGGLLDDRVGSKPVIVGSLAAMIVVGLVLLALSGVAGVLDLRTASVPVRRPHPGVCAGADAANVGAGQGKRGLRPLHHHRARGVFPGAVDVLHVHRPVQYRPGRDGWVMRGAGCGLGGHDRRAGTR